MRPCACACALAASALTALAARRLLPLVGQLPCTKGPHMPPLARPFPSAVSGPSRGGRGALLGVPRLLAACSPGASHPALPSPQGDRPHLLAGPAMHLQGPHIDGLGYPWGPVMGCRCVPPHPPSAGPEQSPSTCQSHWKIWAWWGRSHGQHTPFSLAAVTQRLSSRPAIIPQHRSPQKHRHELG